MVTKTNVLHNDDNPRNLYLYNLPTATMGVVNITNMCSHIQNSAKARLGLTSVPNTKYNLRLAIALHRQGLLSTVTRGGPSPPDPSTITSEMPEPVTHDNVATRRLWLGLKYWDNKPVLSNITAISAPKRLVTLKTDQMKKVARGFSVGKVYGLSLGETIFIATDQGILEIREALQKHVGGLVLCRAS